MIAIHGKSEISNYLSPFLIDVCQPGLCEVHYGCGRLAKTKSEMAKVVLLRGDEVISAPRSSSHWSPHEVVSDFEFPDGVRLKQQTWVDGDFAHADVALSGRISDAELIIEGTSFGAARLVKTSTGILVTEMHAKFKPCSYEIASSRQPIAYYFTDSEIWEESDIFFSQNQIKWRLVLPRNEGKFTVSVHLARLGAPLSREVWGDACGRKDAVEREWEEFHATQVPIVESPDQRMNDLVGHSFNVHRANALQPGGMLPYAFVVPSKITYAMWWMWDTVFHSVFDSWMKDKTLAFGDLLNHTILQSPKGSIPDAAGADFSVTGGGEWVHPANHDNRPPTCTGPCVTGIGLWEVYQKSGSANFLKDVYPHFALYEKWIMQEKPSVLDPDMIAYYNWYDVGWDDSSRWGLSGMRDASEPEKRWDLPVIPVDGNVFYLILRETLGKVAAILGRDAEAADYEQKAARTRQAIQSRMWNEQAGFYFDILPDGRQLSVKSPAGFVPMLAMVPEQGQYAHLKQHIQDPNTFASKYPFPTVSLDDHHFSQEHWWRGSVWPHINWQVINGLFDYDPELALELTEIMVEMMTPDGQVTCREYYDPILGTPGGAIDQGWGVMPADLILRRVMGLGVSLDELTLNPHLPTEWQEAKVSNVFVGASSVNVTYKRLDRELSAFVSNTGEATVTVRFDTIETRVAPGEEAVLTITKA